ncbi:sporulation integral membrane protein YtvI [Desulfofundulus salinus]|uniref:Sporulation integral membrane protein YtvI n=1 Tax=Desulfofundulus salinus TaxID=2419843 RepID=A0A494WU26_9FIRM|nr:sporulation integral membrane protein YtvI [Desulfofundulus salinum]RKO66313.1 sporulation integral membrane protein YtvI [Desulfofundulus salinum]
MPRSLRVAILLSTVLLFYLAWKYIIPELLVILNFFLTVLTPFILAVIIAVLIEPMVRFLHQGCRINRSLAVGLSMLVVIGGVGALLTLLVLRLAVELSELSVRLPQYMGPLQAEINRWVEQGKIFYFQLPPLVTGRIQENMGTFTGWLSHVAGSLAGSLLHLITSLPNAVLAIVVGLIATYFISRDYQLIIKLWLKTAPEPWGQRVVEVSRQVMGASFGYLRAQSFLVTLTTIQSIVGLYIIGAKYSLTIGLLIGLFDIIPVLGPATIYIPWAIWSFITGQITFGVKLVVLYLLVWGVRQTLEARVVAASLGLHPLAVLVAMYVGLKAIGVLGLVLGPLTLIALQAALGTIKPVNHR